MSDIIKYEDVESKVLTIRNQAVIIDRDVAELYGVETREINQAVKNNPDKFPDGYVLVLDKQEKAEVIKNFDNLESLKFYPTSPAAFTERGLYMLATILKGSAATQTTIKKTARAEMYWDKSRNKWRKRKYGKAFFGDTQEEVREQIREAERQRDAGVVIGDQTTLAEFSKEWYHVKTANLRHNTISVYDNALSVHILPHFKDFKLADIKPLDVQKLLAEKSELSKSMQSKILGTLRQLMQSAVDNGLLNKNPCGGISPGGYDSIKKEPLTKEEQSELAKAVRGTRTELFVLLCLFAGLRREEALGLLWKHVHLDGDAPYIDIRNVVTFVKGQPNFSPHLKTNAAYRSVPIPPVLSDVLISKKETATSDFVIPAVQSDGAMSHVAFRRMWESITGVKYKVVKRDKNGKAIKDKDGKSIKEKKQSPPLVSFYVAPHLLRHTYISELCKSGMDIKSIQYLAGHAKVQITLDIYAHVVRNRPSDLSPFIQRAFEQEKDKKNDVENMLSGTNSGTGEENGE